MDIETLRATARELVAPGKGILAADESGGTIKKRFDSIGIESTEDNRRAYRDLLFTTPGLSDQVSGVILFDETIRQAAHDGTPFPEQLVAAGMIPGIKVDTGAKPLAGYPGETVTEGLDGLRERLNEYRELGARFAKWRATIFCGAALPTMWAIARTHTPWRVTRRCVRRPRSSIVEPEVLMDGAHSIDDCEDATQRTLLALYAELADAGVYSRARSSRSTWCCRAPTPQRAPTITRWRRPRSGA